MILESKNLIYCSTLIYYFIISRLYSSLWIFCNKNKKAHQTQNSKFEPSIVIEPNSKHSHVRQIEFHFSHYFFTMQPRYTSWIKTTIINIVIISFRQNIQISIFTNQPNRYRSWTVNTLCTIGIGCVLKLQTTTSPGIISFS